MKRMRIILPVMIAVLSVAIFSQCKKDHTCNMKVTCYYSANNVDADSIVKNAIITFDTIKYTNGQVDSSIACVHLDSLDRFGNERLYEICNGNEYPYKTDNSGVFTYTLQHPALLIVNVTKVDKDSTGAYIKYTSSPVQVQLNDGETTEKTILLVRTN